jgi:hypothetical protein
VFSQQDQQKTPQDQRDRMATTLTGCLNKDTSGSYTLTDQSGLKATVTGAADLEKHSKNHKVTLTGTNKMDASDKPVFEVTKLTQVSDTCSNQWSVSLIQVPGRSRLRCWSWARTDPKI